MYFLKGKNNLKYIFCLPTSFSDRYRKQIFLLGLGMYSSWSRDPEFALIAVSVRNLEWLSPIVYMQASLLLKYT